MVTFRAAQSLNDFYAGALAMFAVILFAKFLAHGRHDDTGDWLWPGAHIICIVAAWAGAMIA